VADAGVVIAHGLEISALLTIGDEAVAAGKAVVSSR
jgi:hypothetical protein